jgi:hypothetical protein
MAIQASSPTKIKKKYDKNYRGITRKIRNIYQKTRLEQ